LATTTFGEGRATLVFTVAQTRRTGRNLTGQRLINLVRRSTSERCILVRASISSSRRPVCNSLLR
jgi:hypothetical protein